MPRLVDGGSDSLIVNGTTGESPTVFYPQKMELFSAVVEAVGERVPSSRTWATTHRRHGGLRARRAELGVDGFMCVVPYYNKPPQEGMYRHFRTIADAVELPIILYNIPGRCVVNMEAETTLRLARDCANIVAVKEASGRMDQVKAIVDGAPEGFAVYSGDDAATFDIMKLGGAGVISTIGNVAP
ncbi:MAG: dihydrodipicolinate synthase family protein, partial [Eggerthellaceae bacterium]